MIPAMVVFPSLESWVQRPFWPDAALLGTLLRLFQPYRSFFGAVSKWRPDTRGSPNDLQSAAMLSNLTTGFIGRLRARDPAAWFELWETFGPILRAQLYKWGRGRIGFETVEDMSQETLAALATSIDRHDPNRGARFSTWLLAIAKHTLGGEIDRRMALKRGAGKKPVELDEAWAGAHSGPSPDGRYEQAVFDAKVEAAIRLVEREIDFMDFSVYRMRIFDGQSGKDVAVSLGVSEPTISRRLSKVRDLLRTRLAEVMAKYSFTEDELEEAGRNGVDPNPTKAADTLFDEAMADIYHRQMALRQDDEVSRVD
jgi:RNA polymerase sigma factor (sigma-70 family)